MQKVILKKPLKERGIPAGTAGGLIEQPEKGAKSAAVQMCGMRILVPLDHLEIVEGERYA